MRNIFPWNFVKKIFFPIFYPIFYLKEYLPLKNIIKLVSDKGYHRQETG